MSRTAEALVIGGGPVGLFAAVSLLDRGASVQVLDATHEQVVRGYACGLHPATSKAFDRVGLMPTVLETAHRIDRLSVRRGAKTLGIAEFAALEGGYPYALSVRQSDLEELLEDAVERRGGTVLRHHSVTQLSLGDGCVRVTASLEKGAPTGARGQTPNGAVREVEADYVIGADGYYSTCRRALGLEMVPFQATKAFAVCDFQADLSGWEREACVALSADSVSAFWPLGPNLGRWTLQIWENLDEALSLERLRALLRERAPWFTPEPEQLCWGAIASFEHRVAHSFGKGRVWLCGDAAHSTSPIGFQSMNRGFCEAQALSSSIARCLYGSGPEAGMFERFERDQQLEWQRLFGQQSGLELLPWKNAELAPCLPASGEDFEALDAQLVRHAARALRRR
jgi:2-polyprenyl-6-methoxyphenol hydroxylase-like FAD-dependent oxidoreductase